MVIFLTENKRKFAWSPADIPRFEPSDAFQKLKVDPNAKKSAKEECVCGEKIKKYSKRSENAYYQYKYNYQQ